MALSLTPASPAGFRIWQPERGRGTLVHLT
jgi:hypothetical protein